MKRLAFTNHSTKLCLAGALLLSISSFTSCDLSDETTKPILIIEPPTASLVIGEDGIPRREDATALSDEMKKAINKEVIGHGWKWLQTYEIDEHGSLINEDYFGTHTTARCCNYYFPSATEMTIYSYTYGSEEPGYFDWSIAIDYSNGDVLHDVLDEKYFLLNILSIFQLDGVWYMVTVERLGMNGNGLGMYNSGFATSEYVRMTDYELSNFQRDYSFDWRMIN
ncbi:MAG: hypothetical protein IKX59_04300 [Bacteroidales bacterium]|nr:hypothetical protein [Bacteroidales bacterium]